MASNDLHLLTPRMLRFTHGVIAKAASRGLTVIVTNTGRRMIEHVAYHAQGRETLAAVNAKRKAAGLPPISARENAKPVTWTMKSMHIIDAEHPLSRAVDFAILKPGGQCSWDLKADVNSNNVADYRELRDIAKEVDPSIIAGFDFPGDKQDPPHYQEG